MVSPPQAVRVPRPNDVSARLCETLLPRLAIGEESGDAPRNPQGEQQPTTNDDKL